MPRVERLLLFAAALLCGLVAVQPRLIYLTRFRTHQAFLALHAASALLLLLAVWRLGPRGRQRAAWITLVFLGVARLLVPFIAPVPHIDSWTLQQEAADFLLRGVNPYAAEYRQIYPPDLFGYVSHYGYLPAVLWFDTVARLLTRDIRFSYALLDLLSAYLVYAYLARRHKSLGLALAVLMLARPMGSFVVEQCWSEPLLVLAAVVAILTPGSTARSAGWSAAWMLAAKQSNVLLLPVAFASGRVRHKLPWMILGFAALSLPMVLWDFEALWRSTVTAFARPMPPRHDGFSLWTVALNVGHVELSGWPTAVLPLGFTALSSYWAWRRDPVRALGAAAMAFAGLFLTARQSFGNYHDFVAALLIVWLALRLRQRGA